VEVFWCCGYTPVELLRCVGLTPVRLLPSMAATTAAAAYLPAGLCPYVRACLARGLPETESDAEPRPRAAGIVVAASCNGMVHLFNAWRECGTGFAELLDVPRHADERAVVYFAGRLKALAGALSARTGIAPNAPALRREMAVAAATRRLLGGLAAVAEDETNSLVLPGSQLVHAARDAVRLPPAVVNAALERLDRRVRGGVGSQRPAAAAAGPRLLLTGTVIEPELAVALEAAGARVVADDLCLGTRWYSRPGMDEADGTDDRDDLDGLIESLARDYLRRPPCPRMANAAHRLNELVDRCRRLRLDGVVCFSLKFCDTMLWDFVGLRRRLRQAGIPLLLLTGDGSAEALGQMRTRLQAFMEIL